MSELPSGLPKFLASKGTHTGSSGFTNYTGGADVPAGLERVWAEFPGAVVLDGTDDWYAFNHQRPERIALLLLKERDIVLLAWFHSGISGMSNSGAVFRGEDMDAIREFYRERFDAELEDHLRVHTQETANAD
jgi:hypothetical protein